MHAQKNIKFFNQFMLYGEEFAVYSEINTKYINAVWAECTNLLVDHVTNRI